MQSGSPPLGKALGYKQNHTDQLRLTVMIGTNLQGAVSPHHDADCALLFVFQQLDVTCSSLLPLWWVQLRGKTIQFSPPGKTVIYLIKKLCHTS